MRTLSTGVSRRAFLALGGMCCLRALLPPNAAAQSEEGGLSAGLEGRIKAGGDLMDDIEKRIKDAPDLRDELDKKLLLKLGRVPQEKVPKKEDFKDVPIVDRPKPVEIPDQFMHLSPANTYPPKIIIEMARYFAARNELDENLVLGVIKAESNFNPSAVSPAGARGLMQLMPGTARDMGVTDVFDPVQNIAGGTKYLAMQIETFHDEELAVAAYNAGPGNIKKYGGIPPFEETQTYVPRVLKYKKQFAVGALTPPGFTREASPVPAALPKVEKTYYILTFKDGYTQRADTVVDDKDAYLVKVDDVTGRVKKDYVESIKEMPGPTG